MPRKPKAPSLELTSVAPTQKDIQASPIGAGVAEAIEDHYISHSHLLKWISETRHKLPAATPLLRREAFLADPLLKGTIYPYLKNVLLQGFSIQTKDNKLYSAAIEEIGEYLEQLGLMQIFREDFLNFMILDGHSYRRIDPDTSGNVTRLEKIEPSSVNVYNDPWDSSIVSYHQRARVKSSWSTMGMTEDVDSWFIPFGKDIKDIYLTHINGRETGNNQDVLNLFESYQKKYQITDITNLRIAAAERIIAMHNSERLINQSYYDYEDGHYRELTNPAPIDSVLLAIWLKRLLLVNAPNLIFVILSPFLHVKNGILKETKDLAGNPVLISSIPPKPSSAMQTANPALYTAQLANFEAWVADSKAAMKNIMECLKNGGIFSSGPDQEIKPVESARSVSFQLIQGLITQLNEEIGLNFGFPMSLVLATGTELASSRNILQIFNAVHAGERTEYEAVADKLIQKMFSERTWQGTTLKDGKEVPVTYSFEDIRAHFTLDIPDTKDLLNQAQTYKTSAEALTQLKGVGASKDDLQALGEEYGFGLLGLDNFTEATQTPMSPQASGTSGGGAQTSKQINAVLKAVLSEVLQEQGVISASPTAPSGFKEKKLTKQLQEAYDTAEETIYQFLEEK